MISSLWRGLLSVSLTVAAVGQTRVDLRTQTQNVDFSGASSTRPLKIGPALPATCVQGEAFFNTAAVPGSNVYLCVGTNTWSQTHAVGSAATAFLAASISGLPSSCAVGEVRYISDASFSAGSWPLFQCTSVNSWTQSGLQADGSGYFTVTCSTPTNCVLGLNTALLPALPAANEWTGSNDFSGASKTAVFRLASAAPLECDSSTRETYFDTSSETLAVCATDNQWTAIASPHGSRLLYQKAGVAAITANGTTQTMDSFTIPAATLHVGDVVEIEANFQRTGSAGGITFEIGFGTSVVPNCCVSVPETVAGAVYRASSVVTGVDSQVWGGMFIADAAYSTATHAGVSSNDISAPITVSLRQNGTGPDTGSVVSWFVKVTR